MAEEKQINLSNSEWRIMEHLWQTAPLTITQLVHSVRAGTGWAPSTIKTLLSRLEAKGAVCYRQGVKARLYTPAVSRSQVVLQETEELLEKAFHGKVGLLMSALVESNRLSREDIEELKQILDQGDAPVAHSRGGVQ